MSAVLGSSWCRTRAVGLATVKDLGRGCGGAFLLLLVLWVVCLQASPQGSDGEGTVRLELEESLSTTAVLAGFAAILATAWSFGEDRRTRRQQLWRLSPLRSVEFVIGRILGLWLGTCTLVLPILLLLVGVWPGGLAGNADWFRPVQQYRPMVPEGAEGAVPREDVILLRSREAHVFEFSEVHGARSVTLNLTPVQYERRREEDRPPRVVVTHAGQTVVAKELPELPGIGAVLTFPEPVDGDLTVTLEAGRFSGLVLWRPGDLRVIGHTRSLWLAVLRSVLGLAALVLLLCCLVSLVGMLVSDVMALSCGAMALLVLMGRGLLLEVSTSVQHMDEHAASEGVRHVASALAWVLNGVPDGAGLVGAGLLAHAEMPGSVDDAATWSLLLVWCLGAAGLAAGAFAVRRRRSP